MSLHQNQASTHSSPLQPILKKLGHQTARLTEDEENQMLSRLTPEAQEYLQQKSTRTWPPPKPNNAMEGLPHGSELKRFLAWTLNQHHFTEAVAVIMSLESSETGSIDSGLFDDVMRYIDDEGPDDAIPPQLLIRWAKRLQIRGDLHGTIRRLNRAQTVLAERKESIPCRCEAERIRGECLQLAGLTLNKMCCWKSAVQPLVEAAGVFRGCPASEKTAEATLVSVEMVARCLCSITHGDYLELKEQLGFQHSDRFYQAYTMCKDSATLANTSQLVFVKVQNQAAESLLKFAAQQEDMDTRNICLQTVILEAQKSLQAHTSMADLTRRERFFELIRSLFLIYLALDFSANPRDRDFAGRLEEQARFLYAEYCKQLSTADFLCDKIDTASCPDLQRWISSFGEDLGLDLDLENVTLNTAAERSSHLGGRNESLDRKSYSFGQMNAEEKQTYQHREQPQPEKGSKTKSSRPYRQEVGLPINPEDYAIPVYDVPLTIFQGLCGCKLSIDQVTEEDVKRISHDNKLQSHTPGETAEHLAQAYTDNSPKLGITMDTSSDSAVALVDTILTTKFPDSETSQSWDLDSGIGSSCSASGSSNRATSDLISSATKLQSAASTDLVRKARLLKFNPVTGLWSCQTTLVYVGQPLQLEDKLKGNCRDALHVQFLHQDEVLGRYVGKRYRRQRPPSQYLQDVTCQKTARFLVTLFNYALEDLRYDIQVVYVPVAHVQLLSRDGQETEDWLNVEPYLEGDFIKLTNNLKYCNSQGRTLATALTHFSYSVSEGKLMLVDLQGWLPREGKGVVYLTDPQFHTSTSTSLSSCDMGPRGMQAFWDSVHPHCNAICQALGLMRP